MCVFARPTSFKIGRFVSLLFEAYTAGTWYEGISALCAGEAATEGENANQRPDLSYSRVRIGFWAELLLRVQSAALSSLSRSCLKTLRNLAMSLPGRDSTDNTAKRLHILGRNFARQSVKVLTDTPAPAPAPAPRHTHALTHTVSLPASLSVCLSVPACRANAQPLAVRRSGNLVNKEPEMAAAASTMNAVLFKAPAKGIRDHLQ